MGLSAQELHAIYQRTVVVRKPTYGIVTGYHELPYVCLGESKESGAKTTRVRGKVHVSPRFIIRPDHLEPSYGEIFGDENVDESICGRIFGFLGFKDRPVECRSNDLMLEHLPVHMDKLLAETLDGLDRAEDITTGVLITPNARYYPVSVERFISSVLDQEFRL